MKNAYNNIDVLNAKGSCCQNKDKFIRMPSGYANPTTLWNAMEMNDQAMYDRITDAIHSSTANTLFVGHSFYDPVHTPSYKSTLDEYFNESVTLAGGNAQLAHDFIYYAEQSGVNPFDGIQVCPSKVFVHMDVDMYAFYSWWWSQFWPSVTPPDLFSDTPTHIQVSLATLFASWLNAACPNAKLSIVSGSNYGGRIDRDWIALNYANPNLSA